MSEQAIAALMADPATHGQSGPVQVVRTHAASIYLAGRWAYKLKRPVVYDYLDFSAPATRRAMLQRELELNGPVAPEIYDRLVPITRAPDGRLALDGGGEAVDWALRMHRFDAADELTALARRGALDLQLAARLGREVAAMHARAPRRQDDAVALIVEILAELAREFATLRPVLPARAAAEFGRQAQAALARQAGLLQRRGAAGHVRRCHGDLHLANIVRIGGRPVPFDALEFDERLGTMDVLYDLAFLLMDMWHAGLHEQANVVLNRWLHHGADRAHLAGLAALPLFLAVRAAIRAMVLAQQGADAAPQAQGYLRAAVGFLAPGRPVLVAVGGLSGSGKSLLAAALAPRLGAAPGAVHLRSDLIRKALAGVSETDRLPRDSYSRAAAAAVYARMRADAAAALAAGQAVVLDAVHLRPEQQAAALGVAEAAGVPFAGLWLEAAPEVLHARVTARRGDASDADAAVLARQLASGAGPGDWTPVDAAGPPEQVLQAAFDTLAGQGALRPV